MNSTSESVVIEDDDDDVEIIDVTCGGYGNQGNLISGGSTNSTPCYSGQRISKNVYVNESVSRAPEAVAKKIAHTRTKTTLPQEINGFLKPSYNYSRLITQALASMPERRSTGLQICDMIAKKHPYYEHLTAINWKSSIYAALRTRKKFFTIVGSDDKNEFIWSFNPTFEQYMLDKWVPKYIKNKSSSSSIPNYIHWLHKSHPQQNNPPVSSESSVATPSSTPPSPVIVLSGTLVSSSPANPSVVDFDNSFADSDPISNENLEKDPLEPEISLLEPDPSTQCDSNVEKELKPWEPEVTVCEDMPNRSEECKILSSLLKGTNAPSRQSDYGNGHVTGRQTDAVSTNPSYKTYGGDFSLDNLHLRHVIRKEEILYRVNFNKEHTSVEKFRLHCTVCDDHLGTSGTACRRRVRLHYTLGVLVCVKCYGATCNPSSTACQWCNRDDRVLGFLTSCCSCTHKFCKVCIERNFGQSWYMKSTLNQAWKCFRCDTKQIWPHRAIAYFLFRHYRELKRKKDMVSKCQMRNPTPRDLRFFIEDLSTCCKPGVKRPAQPATVSSSDIPVASTTNPVLNTTSATPPTTAASSQQSMFVIGEQPPNYIYVHTPSSVPSVTLNTGTQYIHNVFSDKNYVVMETNGEQGHKAVPSINSSVLSNTILYTQPPATVSSFPLTIPPQATEVSVSIAPKDRPPPLYPYSTNISSLPCTFSKNTPPSSYSAINVEVSKVNDLPDETAKNPVSNTVVISKAMENDTQSVTSTSEILRSTTEEPILIPDGDPIELKVQEEKVIAVPFLSARERIERRPMPKSKKQSLLKTVLMNESIESMKRHLQLQSDSNLSTDKNETSISSVSPERSNEGGQNIEEPILKSIIESATERLLSIQRNQNVNTSNNKETRPIEIDSCIDLCEDETAFTKPECKVTDSPITTPKIKIKTLRELQDPEVFNGDHIAQENNEQKNGIDINKESNNNGIDINKESNNNGIDINKESNNTDQQHKNEKHESNNQNVVEEGEVNITDLKQGIIEASRTLINTQKQFKELAKVISSNLIYKPDQAVELVKKFHNILKSCHKELGQIENNVKHQYEHLIPSTDIESILQSVKNKCKEVANLNEGPVIKKKRKKQRRSRIHERRKSFSTVSQQNIQDVFGTSTGNVEPNETDYLTYNIETTETDVRYPFKRKRDLLDFNPLGKKVILGSPEITEEDLRQIPNSWDSSSQNGVLNQDNNFKCHNEVYMEELKRRQYLARKGAWKKKNIWLSTKRKKRKYTKHPLQYKTNGPLIYGEDGSLIKKRPYKKRKKIFDSDDDDDKTYKPNNSLNPYPIRHHKRRSSELSRPLRLSARMHPSTVAHVAQLISSEQRSLNYLSLIKPCYVVLDRLDPEMVQLLRRNVVNLSDNEETDNDLRDLSYC